MSVKMATLPSLSMRSRVSVIASALSSGSTPGAWKNRRAMRCAVDQSVRGSDSGSRFMAPASAPITAAASRGSPCQPSAVESFSAPSRMGPVRPTRSYACAALGIASPWAMSMMRRAMAAPSMPLPASCEAWGAKANQHGRTRLVPPGRKSGSSSPCSVCAMRM
ncbi:hypothetical protein ACLESO_53260 [Pyxidicoccus sp. 3LG]